MSRALRLSLRGRRASSLPTPTGAAPRPRAGADLFGTMAQFRSWLSCRAPRCTSDILVVRYETLNASVPSILDFLDVPLAARSHFPPFTPSPTWRFHMAIHIGVAFPGTCRNTSRPCCG